MNNIITPVDPPRRRPGAPAALATLGMVVVGCLIGAFIDVGHDPFKPRAATLDALAGLAIGAFFVDRLVTFVPVFAIRSDPAQRAADLEVLRLGYGALLGGSFVSITYLPAVAALTDGKAGSVEPRPDRVLAVLAIAGGVAGLARIVAGLKEKSPTDGTKKAEPVTTAAAEGTVPPPSLLARIAGGVAVGIAAAVALWALDDKTGAELLVSERQADGSVALTVRFATVLVGAAIVEQVVEQTFGRLPSSNDKPIITGGVALVLGVVIARIMDLYLLHNVGFFGATGQNLNKAIDGSKNVELVFDTFVTGAVIASGTSKLHDLADRLRKTKPATTTAATAASVSAVRDASPRTVPENERPI